MAMSRRKTIIKLASVVRSEGVKLSVAMYKQDGRISAPSRGGLGADEYPSSQATPPTVESMQEQEGR